MRTFQDNLQQITFSKIEILQNEYFQKTRNSIFVTNTMEVNAVLYFLTFLYATSEKLQSQFESKAELKVFFEKYIEYGSHQSTYLARNTILLKMFTIEIIDNRKKLDCSCTIKFAAERLIENVFSSIIIKKSECPCGNQETYSSNIFLNKSISSPVPEKIYDFEQKSSCDKCESSVDVVNEIGDLVLIDATQNTSAIKFDEIPSIIMVQKQPFILCALIQRIPIKVTRSSASYHVSHIFQKNKKWYSFDTSQDSMTKHTKKTIEIIPCLFFYANPSALYGEDYVCSQFFPNEQSNEFKSKDIEQSNESNESKTKDIEQSIESNESKSKDIEQSIESNESKTSGFHRKSTNNDMILHNGMTYNLVFLCAPNSVFQIMTSYYCTSDSFRAFCSEIQTTDKLLDYMNAVFNDSSDEQVKRIRDEIILSKFKADPYHVVQNYYKVNCYSNARNTLASIVGETFASISSIVKCMCGERKWFTIDMEINYDLFDIHFVGDIEKCIKPFAKTEARYCPVCESTQIIKNELGRILFVDIEPLKLLGKTLGIKKNVFIEEIQQVINYNGSRYRLRGAINHVPRHYTANSCDENGEWFHFNDFNESSILLKEKICPHILMYCYEE